MIKLIDKLMKGIECLVTILLGLEVVVIVAQIFFRYVLRRPLSWSDQACRFGLVWIIMLGVPVMFHRKSTVSFDLIFQKTTGKTRKLFELFFYLCGLFFGLTFLFCCFRLHMPLLPYISYWQLYLERMPSCGRDQV